MRHKVKKISHILSEYFDEKSKSMSDSSIGLLNESAPMPVSPQACRWTIHESPERFSREFKFQNKARVADFVREILVYEQSFGHDGTIKIDGTNVVVEVYTHDINRITELDQEYTKQVDHIYEDVLYFEY